MSISRFAPLLLSFLVACSGEEAAEVDAGVVVDGAVELDAIPALVRTICTSSPGSRLSRQYYEPSEGARQELPAIDTLYNTECGYVAEPDGTYTCYPKSVVEGELLYTDAACTNPVIGIGNNAEVADFHRLREIAGACAEVTYTHRKVGQRQDVAQLYSFAGCMAAAAAPNTSYYSVGAAIERGGFVSATRGPIRPLSRLSTQAFTGDDGSISCNHFRAYDSTLGIDCTSGFAADTMVRCLPTVAESLLVYSEATCTQPEVEVSRSNVCNATPTHIISAKDPLECGNQARHYKPVTQTVLPAWYRLAAACEESTDPQYVVAVVEEEVPAADFAALEAVTETGPGRLHRIIVNHGEEFGAFTKIWHDDKIGQQCTFLRATDGALRCLPAGMTRVSGRYFTDAACTDGIALAVAGPCAEATGHFTADVPVGRRVYSAEAFTAPLWEFVDALCSPATGTFYDRVNEVAPSSFVRADIIVDPTL